MHRRGALLGGLLGGLVGCWAGGRREQILIQRDEESRDKHPVLFYKKLPPKIAAMQVSARTSTTRGAILAFGWSRVASALFLFHDLGRAAFLLSCSRG